jgi:hypothetical protein
MADFLADYADADDRNERYRLLRAEMTRLRAAVVEDVRAAEGPTDDFFRGTAVAETVRDLAGRVDGDLVVFLANDFGYPLGLRPDGTPLDRGNELREAILERKYDDDHEDLATLRADLLAAHPRVHKAIVAAFDDDGVRYYLPPGDRESTRFLTVREMVGLVDYVTNSAQAGDLSYTY